MTWRSQKDESKYSPAAKIAWELVLPYKYLPILEDDEQSVGRMIPALNRLFSEQALMEAVKKLNEGKETKLTPKCKTLDAYCGFHEWYSSKEGCTECASKPTPDSPPVTVEELAQEIAFSYAGCSIRKDSFYLNTAKHLLSKFKLERKP